MQMVRVLFVFKSIRVIYANSVFSPVCICISLSLCILVCSVSVILSWWPTCSVHCLSIDWRALQCCHHIRHRNIRLNFYVLSTHTHTTKWWKFGFQMQITAVGRNWIIIKDYWIGFFVDKCSCSKTNPTKCVTKLVFCFSTISFYVYFFLLQRLW